MKEEQKLFTLAEYTQAIDIAYYLGKSFYPVWSQEKRIKNMKKNAKIKLKFVNSKIED